MKKLLCMMFAAGVMVGCIPTRPEAPKGADAAKKEAEAESKLPAIPPVTKESINEINAPKRAQALADELDRDEKKDVKAVVEARK